MFAKQRVAVSLDKKSYGSICSKLTVDQSTAGIILK